VAAIEEKALDVLDGTANEKSNAFKGGNLLIVIYDQQVKKILFISNIFSSPLLASVPNGKGIRSQQRIDERLYYRHNIIIQKKLKCDGALRFRSWNDECKTNLTPKLRIFINSTMVLYLL
jgi:hypothetical protein